MISEKEQRDTSTGCERSHAAQPLSGEGSLITDGDGDEEQKENTRAADEQRK